MRPNYWFSLLVKLACVIALAIAATSEAQVRIGGWALTGNGELLRNFEYTGACPMDLKFDWGVVSAEPTRITYTYSRSDGGRPSAAQSFNHPGGNRSIPVTQDWHLGANSPQFSNFRGWMQLDIEGPTRVSRRIDFTIHCGNAEPVSAVRVGGQSLRANGQIANGSQYYGSCPVDLQFSWGLISAAPETITYSFRRSDGGHSNEAQSANLRGANQSMPIYDEWRLGANTPQFANYGGWVELHVEPPVSLSSRIGFTIHCQ